MTNEEMNQTVKRVARRDVHTYEQIEENGTTYVRDANGDVDYTKVVKTASTERQRAAYRERMEAIDNELIQSHISANKVLEADSEAYFIFLIYQPSHLFLHTFPKMKKGDYPRLIMLATHLIRNDDRIRSLENKAAIRSDITKILNTTRSTSSRFIDRAEKSGLIEFDGHGFVHLNTSIFKNGDVGKVTKTRSYAKLFIQNIRLLYHKFNDGKRLEKLGTLYNLIPFIDLKYNVLSLNANERIDNEFQLNPKTMEQVGYLLGMSDIQKIKKTLLDIKIPVGEHQLSIVAMTTTGDDSQAVITVNPYFIYRNDLTRLGQMPTHHIFTEEYKLCQYALGTQIQNTNFTDRGNGLKTDTNGRLDALLGELSEYVDLQKAIKEVE